MSDDPKGTTVWIDFDSIAEADAIAQKLGPLVGGKMSRSAAVRRAIHDLFLVVCPSGTTDSVTKNDQVAA